MSLKHWIEDKLDNFTPKVEAIGDTESSFTPEQFHLLMTRLIIEYKFELRSKSGSSYVFDIPGRTVGELSQAKVLLGIKAIPKSYRVHKSRLKCTLLNDGIIRIESFEHLAGLREEREAFKQMLYERLESILQMIDDQRVT